MRHYAIPRKLQITTLILFTVIIVFLRRPDQFLEPYVWVEDGTLHMRHFLEYGYLSLFVPVQGYLLFPAKIINLLGITVSFYYYPEVTLLLTLLFTVAVVIAIATTPTELRWRWLCAVLVLLIPTDPECFGVSLYAFWWGSILLILALLWNWENNHFKMRLFFVFVGGFSSPLIIGLAPIFGYRACIAKQRAELYILLFVAVITVFQIVFLVHNPRSQIPLTLGQLQAVIDKYFGFFLIHSFEPASWLQALAGYLLLGFILVNFYRAAKTKQHSFVLLNIILFTAIAMSAVRTNPDVVHPVLAAPRYFFYPYILLFWTLAWTLAQTISLKLRAISAAFIAIAVLNGLTSGFSRYHDPLDWRGYVDRCVAGEINRIPIHFAGDANMTWVLGISPDECRRLVEMSLIGKKP